MTVHPTGPFLVASGVPFPRGAVTALDHLRLEDAAGTPVPAQFTGLAQWPDRSYKAVLVNLIAEPAKSSYVLRSGPRVTPAAPAAGLTVSEDRNVITVTTGPMRFQVNKQRFTLFERAWVDWNHDGTFADDEQVLRQPGDLFLINASDQAEYRASRFEHPQVTIEESGPLRVVIAAWGKLQAERGGTLTDFIVRLTAAAGQDAVQVDYTLVDSREERDVEAKRPRPALEVTGCGLRLPLKLGPSAVGLFGGDRFKGFVAYGGPVGHEQHLYQNGRFNYIGGQLQPFTFYYEGVGRGERADGWVDASDERFGVSAMVRHFWEQFPKELAVEQHDLIVYLHPPRASLENGEPGLGGQPEPGRYERPKTFYFPREGGAKTYQMLITFHPGRGEARALRNRYAMFDAQPRLITAPGWTCRSGVFGQLLEAGALTATYDSALIGSLYTPSIENVRDPGGLAMLYGWRDYGDRLRPGWADTWGDVKVPGFYNDTHVGAHNFFIQYLRTDDERWYELGEMASRHWMDIDVSHANRLGHWRHGYGPGEGHMITHEMADHTCRNIHWGHAHLSGLPDYYLLTGDRRALEVIREVGDWWTNAAPDFFPVPIQHPHYAEAERDFAWPLFVLNEAYRATGDRKYLKAGAHIVQHLLQWWQTPSDHWVNGERVGRNDWRQGTGWGAMYPRQDNSPDPPKGKLLYNGTNPWMAAALIGAIIQFRELDRDAHEVDDALVEEMLLQTMNYVVKYGYQARERRFVYSEARREDSSGMAHFLYPLAYLARRYRAGGLAHPGWYGTAPRWAEIARDAFASLQDQLTRESISEGFYGYEMVWPADAFTILEELERPAPVAQPAGR